MTYILLVFISILIFLPIIAIESILIIKLAMYILYEEGE